MNELHARVVRVGLAVCVMQGATIAAAAAGPCTAQIEQITEQQVVHGQGTSFREGSDAQDS